ncbi:MAG: anaerobic ribonucleoside-triphosphate reductase [Acidobacteria bacterium]|nr:anaerobic ribonucleoside-triphosphate reductase [Acidobacteriota bacterium]MCW5969089.1 anaerobic ribonucleoside-triphosphate reductase [Blastocatellales bacterium]
MPLTEAELLVRQSDEDVVRFDPQRITDALIRETRLAPDVAQQISLEVMEQIKRSGIRALTSALIRELVDARLLEYGMLAAHRAHARLGVPIYDVDRLIQAAPREAADAHGPEGTSLMLAEAIKREYAMLSVFSETVANAHLSGDLHIENLGEIDRPTTMIGSVDFIKRHGIRLPGGFAGSRPARRPEVLAAHLVKYTAALHGYFSEAIAWDSVNYAMAPLLDGLDERAMKQLAQGMLFELSAPAIARGGQGVRCDLHLDWDAPAYIRRLPALGAGGEKLPETYESFSDAARGFLRALFEVYLEGDGQGLPFTGPRPVLHLTKRFINSPGYRSFLDLVSQAATERGGVVLAFDRESDNDAATAFTTRYGLDADKLRRAGDNWQWRAAVFSSVAINLPRVGYRAEGDRLKVFELLTGLLELAAQASLEKRVFLEKLLARGESGTLALLSMRHDKEPFLPLSWTMHAICPVGLAELAQAVVGEPLDASIEAQDFAAHVLAHLHAEAGRLSAKHKVSFVLAESRDATAPHRLARLDLKTFGEDAVAQSPGESAADVSEAYYTNGAKLPVASVATPFDRFRIEGAIQAGWIMGATSDVWLGGSLPPHERLAVLVSRAFYQTEASAIAFSPDFTICLICRTVSRGLLSVCPQCGSNRVDGLAQSTNRYGRTSVWPKWKLAELQRRRRENE